MASASRASHGLDDLSGFADDELCADMSSFMGDGGVFSKAKTTKFFDAVWQEDPERMVKYRPSILHAYGWMPGLLWRNMKGTVFADGYLIFQVATMSLWVGFIEATAAYWTDDADVQTFIKARWVVSTRDTAHAAPVLWHALHGRRH